jgi:hypothetical protein
MPPSLQIVKLKAFSKFENTTEALAAATALVDSKLGKGERATVLRQPHGLHGACMAAGGDVGDDPRAGAVPRRRAVVGLVADVGLPPPSSRAGLKKFLKKHVVGEELAVLDKKLGSIVKEKLGIECIYK